MQKDARKYARIKVSLKITDLVFTCAYLVIFQFFASPFFKELAFDLTDNVYLAIAVYLACFSVILYMLTLPLSFYATFVIEHKFSLSNQSFSNWSKDELKKSLISFFIFIVIIQILYAILRNFPSNWWIFVSVLWVSFSIILANIMPTLILPLFYKCSTLEKESLKRRIKDLAGLSKIKLLDVYKIDLSKKTKKSNAAVIGLGNTRRVVLGDNLIDEFPEEEVGVVVAHEFAHHKHLHMWKHIFFGGLTSFLCFFILFLLSKAIVRFFGAEAIYDIALFPSVLFLFFVFGIVILPVQNWYSRALERDADKFALALTQDKPAFISLMNRLAEKNLADKNPSKIVKFFFYDHPPISERIAFAQKWNHRV